MKKKAIYNILLLMVCLEAMLAFSTLGYIVIPPVGKKQVQHRRANRKECRMIYVIIVAGIFLLELTVKGYVEKHLQMNSRKSLLRGKILLQKYHNEGAFLNFGEKKRQIVAVVSVLLTVIVFCVFIFTLGQKGNSFLKTGLSFLLGGAFSNTYDRLRRKYVVDYLSFQVRWKPLRQIVFNIADFFVLGGALMCTLALTE